jgi:hypothetical protein
MPFSMKLWQVQGQDLLEFKRGAPNDEQQLETWPTIRLSFDASSLYRLLLCLILSKLPNQRNKTFGNTKAGLTCGMPRIRIE